MHINNPSIDGENIRKTEVQIEHLLHVTNVTVSYIDDNETYYSLVSEELYSVKTVSMVERPGMTQRDFDNIDVAILQSKKLKK